MPADRDEQINEGLLKTYAKHEDCEWLVAHTLLKREERTVEFHHGQRASSTPSERRTSVELFYCLQDAIRLAMTEEPL